ncbi:hypothetical protein Q73A0000_12975 [Kaistella flava (ex Peng et al. 2021)]|uniref:Uncharacterized protein n=1 Tax=Kaistella flava (ex Peng et al. 2021) TaxID=2038776 RepID=A0A7M2YCU7_9FLAO|nr:hypothetical protein [Kaistella flava (ex Peng et al. 2021)]QOW11203.1 hypothetical protein Q73A0000_12975 [Kaistella flava (ex Peng et al. 2021)]
MVKNLLILILAFLLFSCKKEDENFHLKYEVLNQLIAADISENKASGYTEEYLYKISKPIDLKFREKLSEKKNEIIEPTPPSSHGIIYLPENGTFTKDDLAYIKIQIKTNSNFVLDTAKITSKVEFIDTEKFKKFQKSQEKYLSVKDYWKKFREEFGDKCLRNYSIPYFNKEKNICIVINSISCGPLWGGGETSVYKKINGKWKVIKTFNHWVS